MQGRKLLHGGDYNPEQWLDRPDILEQDIELMKRARVNTVTLGVFSWSVLEPAQSQAHRRLPCQLPEGDAPCAAEVQHSLRAAALDPHQHLPL